MPPRRSGKNNRAARASTPQTYRSMHSPSPSAVHDLPQQRGCRCLASSSSLAPKGRQQHTPHSLLVTTLVDSQAVLLGKQTSKARTASFATIKISASESVVRCLHRFTERLVVEELVLSIQVWEPRLQSLCSTRKFIQADHRFASSLLISSSFVARSQTGRLKLRQTSDRL